MKVEIGNATLYLGDCAEILPTLGQFDALLTDPPYPDWLTEEYKYFDGLLEQFKKYDCQQLIFWTIKQDFPLDWCARHIWDKKTGCASEYEFIYERNGGKNFKVFRQYLINSDVAAKFNGEEWTGHKSQKPIKLMQILVEYLKINQTILDPFMGSGSTGVACAKMGKNFIGIEQEPKYFDMACKRIELAYAQPDMFIC